MFSISLLVFKLVDTRYEPKGKKMINITLKNWAKRKRKTEKTVVNALYVSKSGNRTTIIGKLSNEKKKMEKENKVPHHYHNNHQLNLFFSVRRPIFYFIQYVYSLNQSTKTLYFCCFLLFNFHLACIIFLM